MRFRILTGALGVLALLSVQPLAGQQGAVEFGLDAGLVVSINDNTDNLTTVCIPCQKLRIGFFVSDAISFEPAVSLNVLSGGGETFTTFVGGASLLYHFTTDPARTRTYFRGGANFSLIDLGGESVNQFGVGGGIGIKVPTGDLAARLEGIVGYNFENDDFVSSFDIGAMIGLSFFAN